MADQNINTLRKLIAGYKAMNDKLESMASADMLAKLPKLLEGYFHVKEAIINNNKQVAPDYNIFSIARFELYEAKLHSPFISNLLDPGGSHSQGDMFLRSFFNQVPGLETLSDGWDFRFVKVSNELGAGVFGNIDITIQHLRPDNPFIVIIENKIDAYDQINQIHRYYDFACKTLGLHDNQIKILYLSLDETEPSEIAVNGELRSRLLGAAVLKNISYKDHVRRWLMKVIPLINAPVVSETVGQYLKTVNRITNAKIEFGAL